VKLPILIALLFTPWILGAELYRHAIAATPASSFVLSVGCVAFLFAMLWLLHGVELAKRFLFPILFLFVAVPIPQILWSPVVLGLQALITSLNVETLNVLGIPATQSGNTIRLPQGVVGIDEACSGIRSLQSSIMAALFIADLTLQKRGAKLFFVLAGVALAMVGNLGRSLYLSLTAARDGVTAVAGVHDTAGWSVLIFTAAGLAALAWWVTKAERRAIPPADTGDRLAASPPTSKKRFS
jgi:exosortase